MFLTPVVRDLDEKVYEPAEDSFLLLDSFEAHHAQLKDRWESPVVVEIGAGSGVVSTFIRQHILPNGLSLAIDINPSSCKAVLQTAKANGVSVDALQMDLTLALRAQSADLLVFNPPYVPAEEVPQLPATEDDDTWLDLALLGGTDGMVVTWKVLDGLDTILSPTGVAYVLFCARNHPETVARTMRDRGWKVDRVLERKAGWEVLSVYTFERQ